MMYRISMFFLLLLIALLSCRDKDAAKPVWHATTFNLEIPKYFPTELNIPPDNPMTVEGVELGRYLFYDGRLSGRTDSDSLMSCANCHVQAYNFRPGIANPDFEQGMPEGIMGVKTMHSALPLINLIWNKTGYTWNGAVHPLVTGNKNGNLEDIVIASIVHPAELAGDTTTTVELFQNLTGYPDLFYNAFGSEKVTADRIAKAISQFIRTFISANSRFDKYMRGELQLTNDELAGFVLFTTEEGGDCFHCHGSSGNPLFTTNLFYNNGKDTLFNTNDDRFAITGKAADIGAYKSTTLRNIAVGGPYMHDGRFQTLDQVIDFYSHNLLMSDHISPLMHHASNGGIQLTSVEKYQLKAFLNSLTDEEFLNNPAFGPPSVFPDGKIYQK